MSPAGKPPPVTVPALLRFPLKTLGRHSHLSMTAPASAHPVSSAGALVCSTSQTPGLQCTYSAPGPIVCSHPALKKDSATITTSWWGISLSEHLDEICQGAEAPADANRCLVLYPGCLTRPAPRMSSSTFCLQLELQVLKQSLISVPKAEIRLACGTGQVRCHLPEAPASFLWSGCDPCAIDPTSADPPHALGWLRELRWTTQCSHTSYKLLNLWRDLDSLQDSLSPPHGHHQH